MQSVPLCRVLIVDDEQLICKGIRHYLDWQTEGFDIIGEAANGQEAITWIEKEQPHIILTDLVMPIMDGEELTKYVKTNYPDIEVIILSSYSDFDFVRSTFQNGVADYILKPKVDSHELLQVLLKVKSQIPSLQMHPLTTTASHQLSNNWLQQFINDQMTTTQIIAFDKQNTDHSYLQLIMHQQECTSVEIMSNVVTRCQDLITETTAPLQLYYDYVIAHRMLILLFDGYEQTIQHIYSLFNNISSFTQASEPHLVPQSFVTKLQQIISEPFITIVITPFRQWSVVTDRLKLRFQQIPQLSFYNMDPGIYIEDHINERFNPPPAFDTIYFNELIKRLKVDEAFHELLTYNRLLIEHYCIEITTYKVIIQQMLIDLTNLLYNLDENCMRLHQEKYTYLNLIQKSKSALEVSEHLVRYLKNIRSLIPAEANTSTSNMQQMITFIEKHYAEPLSLKELATKFHFNVSYLSSYFSSHHKEGFIDVLNKIRIQRAMDLLKHDVTSIAEISGLVGYSDHSYFCRVFKKITGCSPSQYRRQSSL